MDETASISAESFSSETTEGIPEAKEKKANDGIGGENKNDIKESQIDAHKEETTVWIHPKTGKEMKSSLNQTNVQWEKKPLAEVLRRGAQPEGFSWESGNGGVSPISQRIHVPYNPDDPEWAGYPNPFEY